VGEAEWDEFEIVVGENLLGLRLQVSLMEEERRRRNMGSRVKGKRVPGGRGQWRRNEGHL